MDKKILNITAGKCMNEKMKNEFEEWVPFNEDMSKGEYNSRLFSEEFLLERSKVHNVNLEDYIENMKEFLDVLGKLNDYKLINLWFGEDAVCLSNSETLYNCLMQYGYKGELIINIVDEISLEIQKRFLCDFSNNPF